MPRIVFALSLMVGVSACTLCRAAAPPVTTAHKQEFINLLETASHQGEFFTAEGIDQLAPHVETLFALTPEDISSYDLYPFLALSRGLCDRQRYRDYGVAHFAEIAHPTIKLCWAVMLFDGGSSSPEVVGYLRAALDSKERSKDLADFLGPEFEQFKKRLSEHRDEQR